MLLAAALPWGDWQFWVVTLPVFLIVAGVVRSMTRFVRKLGPTPPPPPPRKASLTIGGQPVRRS